MKYDCSRTLDFSHEVIRMCETSGSCSCCPFNHNYSCKLNIGISQKEIDIVQKWSDEHPEETMCEHFKKLFPNAPYCASGIPRICPEYLGWANLTCGKGTCEECWNKPYKENIPK